MDCGRRGKSQARQVMINPIRQSRDWCRSILVIKVYKVQGIDNTCQYNRLNVDY